MENIQNQSEYIEDFLVICYGRVNQPVEEPEGKPRKFRWHDGGF